jgi:hypothetical protein
MFHHFSSSRREQYTHLCTWLSALPTQASRLTARTVYPSVYLAQRLSYSDQSPHGANNRPVSVPAQRLSYSGQSRETTFAFPPAALLNRFVAKACADDIRAVVVTSLAVSALYWTKLLRASVVHNTDGYLRVRRQWAAFSDLDAAGELAIFAVDFSRGRRGAVLRPAPPCGHEGRFRGRDTRGSPLDHADHTLMPNSSSCPRTTVCLNFA